MLSNATNQPKSTVELGYMCHRGVSGPPAVALTKELKYKKRLLLRCNKVSTKNNDEMCLHHMISHKLLNILKEGNRSPCLNF